MTDTVRLGIAGCGQVVERLYLPVLNEMPDWTVEAACDPSKDRRRWISGQVTDAYVTEDLETLLAKNKMDLVLIASPPETHVDLATRCLSGGCPVLLEKPFALSVEGAEHVAQTAKTSGVPCFPGYNRRFLPSYQRLKELVGKIHHDDVTDIEMEFIIDPASWQDEQTFRTEANEGANGLDDVGVHLLDLAQWLWDCRVNDVRASIRDDGDQKDVYDIQLFMESGVRLMCHTGYARTYRERVSCRFGEQREVAEPGYCSRSSWPMQLPTNISRTVVKKVNGLRRRVFGLHSPIQTAVGHMLKNIGEVLCSSDGRDAHDLPRSVDGCHNRRVVRAVRECLKNERKPGVND
jgi:predicted dehydrogenase